MARALQCPACSTRHAIDGVDPGSTFACSGCGRTLRAPGTSGAASGVPPTTAGAGSDPSASGATRAERRLRADGPPSGFPTPVRVGAWIVAVLLGGAIALFIARAIGLLSTNNLIDVITGSGSGRYLRMALLVPIWALVATGIVTLLLDGGWRLLHRDAAPPTRRPARPREGAGPSEPVADHVPAAARQTSGVPDRTEAQRPRRIPPRDTGA